MDLLFFFKNFNSSIFAAQLMFLLSVALQTETQYPAGLQAWQEELWEGN